jgi:hypothetical protein
MEQTRPAATPLEPALAPRVFLVGVLVLGGLALFMGAILLWPPGDDVVAPITGPGIVQEDEGVPQAMADYRTGPSEPELPGSEEMDSDRLK